MRKNFFKIITIILSIICIALIVVLISMKVVNGKEKGKKDLLSSKILDELSFIDYNVIDAMNKLNNISVTRYKVYTKTVNNREDSTSEIKKNSNNSSNNSNKGSEKQGEGEESDQNGNSKSEDSKSKDSLSSSGSSSEASNGKDQEKISENVLVNSLTETDNQETDWNTITSIYENLLSTWPTTQLDLKKAGISNEYLENVNVDLNGIAQSILNKDKNSCLVNLYNLYAQIPVYTEILSSDTYTINLYNTKMAILNAYTLANSDNKWNEISASVKSAKTQFEKIVNMKEEEKSKNNLEKIYSMLQNLESTVALNNKNIFYMQYKNIMQEISNI